MKKRQYSIILLILVITICTVDHGRAMLSREEGRPIVLNMLKKYSPFGYTIIVEYESAPEETRCGNITKKIYKNDFWNYSNKLDELSVAKKLDVVVHETCHNYAAHMAWPLMQKQKKQYQCDTDYMAIYAGNNSPLFVPITRTFPSRKIARTFTDDIKTFRFDKYITKPIGGDSAGTQVHGIYGLLDELNAYYYGFKTAHDLIPYYTAQKENILNAWITNYFYADRAHRAYLEFKLYILKYLLYAKKRERSVYQDIMKNTVFKMAFTSLNTSYDRLIRDYYRTKKTIIPFLNRRGYRVYTQGGYLMYPADAYQDSQNLDKRWVKSDLRGKYLSTSLDYYSREITPLQKELKKEEYRKLEKELAQF